ncbi:hypothetical protein BGX20_004804, partial [Mortierella sp. AD010]
MYKVLPKIWCSSMWQCNKKKRKRVEETDGDSGERPTARVKSYGIVTDAFKWTFVECTLEDDETLTFKVKEVMENFRLKHGDATLREDSETLFGYVLSCHVPDAAPED